MTRDDVHAEIRRTVAVFCGVGDVIELRVPSAGRSGTISGYYDDLDALVHAALRLDARLDLPGIYITPNPVNPALLARAANRTVERAKHTTSDADIVRRRWLLVDLDPVRPAGVSSTDAEHAAALSLARAARDWLAEHGIGRDSVALADSGNGAHLLVRVELANDAAAAELCKRCVAALDLCLSSDAVHVDTTTCNAARIWKLYGTVARKGDDMPDRPHRRARILEVPQTLTATPRELLERLAALVPHAPEPDRGSRGNGGRTLDVRAWLADHGIVVAFDASWNTGHKWILSECPFAAGDHGRDRGAYIVQHASGAIAAGCHHARCTWGWRELRTQYEPRAERKRSAAETGGMDSNSGNDADRSCVTLRRPSELKARPIEWLVDGLLPRAMFAVLHGKDKLGKTLLAWEMARAILFRELLFRQFATAHGRVVLALLDDPHDLTVARRDALGLSDCDDLRIVTPLDADLTDPERFLADFCAKCADFKPSLVFLDALYMFAPAGRDSMNDASRMGRLMRAFDALAENLRATVLLAAHDRKDGLDVAGSHVIRAAAKALLHLERPRWSQDADEEDDGRRGLTVVSKLTGEAKHLLRCRGAAAWTYIGRGDSAREARGAWARDRVSDYLRAGDSGTAEEIARHLRMRKADALAALTELEETGDAASELQPRADGKKGKGRRVYAKAGTFAPKDNSGNDSSAAGKPAPDKGSRTGPIVPASEINGGPDDLFQKPSSEAENLSVSEPTKPIVPESFSLGPSGDGHNHDADPEPCPVCGGDDWRLPLGAGGKVVCGVCHPSARFGLQ